MTKMQADKARAWLRAQPPLFVAETDSEALAFQASVVADLDAWRELLGVVAEVQAEAVAGVDAWLVGFQARGGVVVHGDFVGPVAQQVQE